MDLNISWNGWRCFNHHLFVNLRWLEILEAQLLHHLRDAVRLKLARNMSEKRKNLAGLENGVDIVATTHFIRAKKMAPRDIAILESILSDNVLTNSRLFEAKVIESSD